MLAVSVMLPMIDRLGDRVAAIGQLAAVGRESQFAVHQSAASGLCRALLARLEILDPPRPPAQEPADLAHGKSVAGGLGDDLSDTDDQWQRHQWV
jgi:hypothetical protein